MSGNGQSAAASPSCAHTLTFRSLVSVPVVGGVRAGRRLPLPRDDGEHGAPLHLRAPVTVAAEVAVVRGGGRGAVQLIVVEGVGAGRGLVVRPVGHLAVEVGVVPQQGPASWHWVVRLPLLEGAHPGEGAGGQPPVPALQPAARLARPRPAPVRRPAPALPPAPRHRAHADVDGVPVLGEGGGAHQAGSPVAARPHQVLGRAERARLARRVRQRAAGGGAALLVGEAVVARGLDVQLRLLLVVVVDVLAEVLVLLDHAGGGVAEDGAHHGGEAPDLDPGQHADGAADAHAHEGAYHGQAGHGDGRVVMIAVLILKVCDHPSKVLMCNII